jgi:hypothetical protein
LLDCHELGVDLVYGLRELGAAGVREQRAGKEE